MAPKIAQNFCLFLVAVNHPASAAAGAEMEGKIARVEGTQRGRRTIHRKGASERASEREREILKAGDGRVEKQKSRRRAAQGRVLGIYKNPGACSDKERLGDAAVLPLFYRRFWSSSEPEHTDSPARKLTLTQTHTDGGRDAAAEEGEG